MKSRLLDHRTLDNLILQPDLDSLIGELEKTPYRDDIIKARGRYTGISCIEYALRKNFVRTFPGRSLPLPEKRKRNSSLGSSSTAGMSRTSRRSSAGKIFM